MMTVTLKSTTATEWHFTTIPNRKVVVEAVAYWAEASKVVRDYIALNDLGASQFMGGIVRHKGKIVGRISYNGRAWGNEDQEIALTEAK